MPPPLFPDFPTPVRVLIVDDDEIFAGSLSAILSGNPRLVVVDRATDGVEGVTLAFRHRPDVVVMDVNMPLLDGFAATREIRKRLPDARIVIVSAAPEEGHLGDARRAGADVYLRKDCGFDALMDAVIDARSGALDAKANAVTAG
jgi:DNA-binding NarL/FixJ family response regulator